MAPRSLFTRTFADLISVWLLSSELCLGLFRAPVPFENLKLTSRVSINCLDLIHYRRRPGQLPHALPFCSSLAAHLPAVVLYEPRCIVSTRIGPSGLGRELEVSRRWSPAEW